MPYRMRGLGLRPVNSLKHVVDTATAAVTNIVSVIPIVETKDSPVSTTPTQVTTASRINAIYLRVEVLATGTAAGIPRIYMTVQKRPGNTIPTVDPNSVGISPHRKWIIHQEMIMVADSSTTPIPRTMFQGVISIPQKMRRFGVSDQLNVNFQHDAGETTAITNVCIQCIYKEFR